LNAVAAKLQKREDVQKQKEKPISGEIKVMYGERYIPDDSDEAKQIIAKQEKYKNETTSQRLMRLAKETQMRMESTGLKMYIWETSGDERVCSSCRKMDE
jgi:uncharacterized protein with gpF-like domain